MIPLEFFASSLYCFTRASLRAFVIAKLNTSLNEISPCV